MAALGALALGLNACAESEQPLRVGANVWPGYAPIFLAEALAGSDSRHPLKAFYFPNAVDVMRAYRNRLIDVAAVTMDEALLLAQQDPEQRVILICNYSNGADMILARPEIRTTEDLRSKRVGLEPNALGAFMLARALEQAGLSPDDVTIVPGRMEDFEDDFAKGRVDAVVVFEPVATRILGRGARRIFDSRQIPMEIVDVLVTRQSVIAARPRALQALVDGWFAGLEQLRREPRQSEKLIANRFRLPADTFPAAFDTITLLDRQENERLFEGSPSVLDNRLRELQAVMLREKLLPAPVPIKDLIDRRFLRVRADR